MNKKFVKKLAGEEISQKEEKKEEFGSARLDLNKEKPSEDLFLDGLKENGFAEE